MEIAEGLHRIGSDHVSSYLVLDPEGVTVIDAGVPGLWRYLEPELAAAGRSLADVRALVLTHGDTDHIGFASRLHAETGVRAHVHQADADRARLEVSKPNSGWGPIRARSVGPFLWYSARHGGLRPRPVTEIEQITDGQTLDAPGSPRIIHLPGHTPGSVAVHVPAVDALFMGDSMTTRNVLTGAEGPKPAPFTLDPRQATESLQRIEEIQATWVLPGHGPAWGGGVQEAVRQIRAAAA